MHVTLGREFIEKMAGKPFCLEYTHFFCDEELHEVAKEAKLLWHRRDLTQLHDHWSRSDTGGGAEKERPKYLDKARDGWKAAKKLFRTRKQAKRMRTELRRYPVFKRVERLQADARRQIETGVDRFLGTFQIASKSDLDRIDRKLDRISRKLKDIEQPRRGNGAARSHL